MSVKIDFKPTELANKSTLKRQFKKIRTYYDKFFLNLNDDEDLEDNDDTTDNKNKN
jgi:hypothetical protein